MSSDIPKKLHFKNTHAAFEYICEYMDTNIREESLIMALVNECGPVKDGLQNLALKIPSNDGGFVSYACSTLNENVPHVNVGDLVAVKVGMYNLELGPSGFIGFVIGTVEPVYDVEAGGWVTARQK